MTVLKLWGFPDAFGYTLLMLGLILTLGPYFFGLDFGVLKIPNFGDNIRKYLTFIGPIWLVLAIGLYLPFLPSSEEAKASLPPSDEVTVRMSDVDDRAELYINGKLSYKAQYGYQGYEPTWFPFPGYDNLVNSTPGDSQNIIITSNLKPGENKLRFRLWDSGIAPGAASLRISVKKNGHEIIKKFFSLPYYKKPAETSFVYDETFTLTY